MYLIRKRREAVAEKKPVSVSEVLKTGAVEGSNKSMKRTRSQKQKFGLGAQAFKQLSKILGTGPEESDSKKKQPKLRGSKKRKRLETIGDVGEFTNKQIALQLGMLLFESDSEGIDCMYKTEVHIDWKYTSDVYARWCITFILLGDEKSSGGLPSLKTGLERILFMLDLAEESLALHNSLAARGITKALRHEYIAWLCEFLSNKSKRRLHNLTVKSKNAFERNCSTSLKTEDIARLAKKIQELQAKQSPDSVESDPVLAPIEKEDCDCPAKGKTGSNPPSPEYHLVKGNEECELDSGDENETTSLRPSVSAPIGSDNKDLQMLDKLAESVGAEIQAQELKRILKKQILRARGSEELKAIYKAVQANLNVQISHVFRQSGLM